tara:strand:+ start:1093 stop:2442 length:1350 start_codon:yes stop_codon:yes gene_type:complete
MATRQLFYLDAATLENATAVYTDVSLQTLAADGYYSNNTISRQQLNGLLQVQETCANCSAPPTPPTTYTVTQNISNNITGGTRDVDYVLVGQGFDPGVPEPATKTGAAGTPYFFRIGVSVINSAKRFKTSNPFVASNPSGNIPVGGDTVVNTLSGELEDIVTTPPTKFYFISPCSNNQFFTTGGYIEATDANKPTDNQRFGISDPIDYPGVSDTGFFDPAANENNPIKTTVSSSLILNSTAGQNLTVVPTNETGCPSVVVPPVEYIYQLRKCSDQTNTYYFRTTQPLNNLGTRVSPNGTDIYITEQLIDDSQLAGKSELTGIQAIDVFGVLESSPSFRGYAIGCPEPYILFVRCDVRYYNSNNSQYTSALAVSPQPVSYYPNGATGLWRNFVDNACYVVAGTTETPQLYNQAYSITRIGDDDDCNSCSSSSLYGPAVDPFNTNYGYYGT